MALGASNKGKTRLTSLANRRNWVIPMMLSALSTFQTATYSPESKKANNQTHLQKIPAHVLIELLMEYFPQFGSLIYLVYFGYKIAYVTLQEQKEFRNLIIAIKENEQLIETIGKYVLENGIRKLTDKSTENNIRFEIENEITNLLVSKVFQQIIKKSIEKDQKRQEKLQTMIASSLSQFIVSSLIGSSDKTIISAAKILVNKKLSNIKYEQFLNQILPMNMIIASIKLQLAEIITKHIESIAKDIGIKLAKKEKDDIDLVVEEVIANLPPSVFQIPLETHPRSYEDIKKIIEQIGEDEIKNIILLVIQGLKQRQTSLGEYL